ncbi:MAG TPA: LPS-assembly protein LptD [Thermosulfurimonas dismutans]|uniref:LPS-assembly protein LptD n=1 Tax=Thermosulfurimonas dismutans TaxID=999894 RepID=A0A7C3GQ51_9BACT|nr:LPS-assembly protein LptD [Thermosulfurimonas dismutans]
MKIPALVCLILILWGGLARAAWRIEARKLTLYHQRHIAIAEGQVVISGRGLTIFAPRARYEMETKRLWLWGPVKILTPHGDWLKGKWAVIDLRSGEGEIEGAYLFIKKDRVQVRAKRMVRLGEDRYEAYQAVISTCDLRCEEAPPWSFHARKVEIREGRARAHWVSFWVKRLPLALSPLVTMAIKRKRKSGFLFPRLVTGSRSGVGVEAPLFLALHDSFDATLSPLWMSRRGVLFSVEGRWRLSRDAQGIIRYRYLHDRLEDRDYNHDGIVRGNTSRYWITARVDQRLSPRTDLHLDLDLLSDRDFLEEFEGGPFGFSETNRVYLKWFGRSLEERNQRYRTSRLWLAHRRFNTYLEAGGAYRDWVLPGGQATVLSPLADIYLFSLTRPLRGPFTFNLGAEGTYWYREEGSRGWRFHLAPELALNLPLGPLENRFSYQLLHTRYAVDWDNGTTRDLTRTLYQIKAESTLEFYRVYPLNHGDLVGLRHSLRPYLRYFYRPPKNQEDLPLWESADRLPPAHYLEYGVLQFLTAKSRSGGKPHYWDLMRFNLYQRYDFRREASAGEERHPFSNLFSELEVRFPSRLSLRYDLVYNFYGLGLTRQELNLSWSRFLLDRVNVGYQRDKLRRIKQLNLSGRKRFWHHFILHGALSRNLIRQETSSASLGLTYEGSCFSLDFTLGVTPEETRFSFWVNLYGLGGYGRQFTRGP